MQRYARIVYGNSDWNPKANLGDFFQTFAIDNLYRLAEFGGGATIIDIPRNELKTYCGEQVILPMQGYFGILDRRTDIFPLSPNITPLFLGFHCSRVTKDIINEIKKYEPIGCRDWGTFKLLSKCGVNAFISGCMTITLPTAEENKRDKVIFSDVNSLDLKHCPKEIMQDHIAISHAIEKVYSNDDSDNIPFYEERARDLLGFYKEHAALVVTTRLHCAAPCLGMGIPVVLVRNKYDMRFSFIDKYVPLNFTKSKNINWYPEVKDISREKETITQFAVKSIKEGKIADSYFEVHEIYNYERGKLFQKRKSYSKYLPAPIYRFLRKLEDKIRKS